MMDDAFRRCFPITRDLPAAISDALARLMQLEAAATQSAASNAGAAAVLPPSQKFARSDNLAARPQPALLAMSAIGD
jgi:hypothetical protein